MLQQIIKDYRIISLLGEGGMANVYLAEHLTLRNKVAIKILKEDYVQNANIRKRFLAEARSLAQMSHPNIIKVTDLIDAGDIVAFVMEHIEGQTLEAYLSKKGGLARAEIEGFFNQMILAVEYVHEQGLIHRDIKPSNFMVTKSGQIKLLDFGIAKNTNEGAVDYTKTGLMQQMGTPLYMSPEQVKNTAEVTKQTDVYSLGVVLWQLVMNKKPYDSDEISLPEIQVAILKERLPLTHTIWDSTIQQATEKDPAKRSLKINYNKILKANAVSDNKINLAIPKHNPEKKEPKRIAYINFKTISIAIGILLFVGIIIIIIDSQNELNRQGEKDRQNELNRQAEQDRQNELNLQAEQDRQNELNRQSEQDRQNELNRQRERDRKQQEEKKIDKNIVFKNNSSVSKINVALLYWDGSTWVTEGWWHAVAGSSLTLPLPNNYTVGYFYYHAYSGNTSWGNGTTNKCVSNSAFTYYDNVKNSCPQTKEFVKESVTGKTTYVTFGN